MNIAGVYYESVNDGEGMRTVIFVSGCSHNCYNCHNPNTHDINYGIEFTNELKEEIFDNIEKRPFISGITISGGDPLHENNAETVCNLIAEIRERFPDKNIWLYTGYKYENIFCPVVTDDLNIERDKLIDNRINAVKMCDVVIDGRYVDELRDVTLMWRGSSNQRVIDVKKSLEEDRIVLYN